MREQRFRGEKKAIYKTEEREKDRAERKDRETVSEIRDLRTDRRRLLCSHRGVREKEVLC